MPSRDREHTRAYQSAWVAKRRAEWLGQRGPCSLCGSPDRLEVHHADPAEKVSHRIWSWSRPRREAELAKCVLLCNACHKLQHEAQHGTDYKYRVGCRCVECRAAHRDKQRRWRSRTAPTPSPLFDERPAL